MIAFRTEHASLARIQADVVACFVSEDKPAYKHHTALHTQQFPSLSPAFQAGTFTGKFQETITLFPSEKKVTLLLVGLGKNEQLSIERIRKAAATAAKTAHSLKAKTLALVVPDPATISSEHFESDEYPVSVALVEGSGLSLYRFNKYLTVENSGTISVKRITLVANSAGGLRDIKNAVAFATTLVEATWLARDLANAPPNEIYPETLAQHAKQAGRKNRISVTVLDEKRIQRLDMGGVLAVAKGSEKPPRFIIMEYNKKRNIPTIVLVGKGVTFDSGGISIKPAAGMGEMKMDMAGAAAVIATMQAAAKLKLPIHLVGLVPAVENLLSGRAMKPGDIITHLNGKTSEVDNTDAEGRLILADALSFASRYRPGIVIDLATLTGHVVVTLGHFATGMLGNDQTTMDMLKEAGERTYERVWQLPMFDEYEKLNKSDVADVRNSGGRAAGTITAAFFLKQFIGEYKWVHLDIAGTAILSEPSDYIPKGGSGVGVRLLVDFLRHYKT
ncbi:MAG: leucyl aminopeptidase [Bacteroidetes bacterium]|nr:leucyl aminopeptidase [Bacteroidota bacterium]MCW5897493.1 leucyl aminopeptidase [Bacteroidota bacterium]